MVEETDKIQAEEIIQTEENIQEEDFQNEETFETAVRRHHTRPEGSTTLFKIRQVLNVLFILLAIAGVAVHVYGKWYAGSTRMEMMGGVIVVIAISIKMAECVLRYKK